MGAISLESLFLSLSPKKVKEQKPMAICLIKGKKQDLTPKFLIFLLQSQSFMVINIEIK